MAQGIAQLSAAMAVGDSEAVDAFYRQYFDWMYGQARRVTRRDESFCLDVVQDAVLRVIRTVKPVDEEGRFRGWLQLVVKTTAFDLLRNERRRKNREAMAGVVATTAEPDVDSLQLDWLQDQITRLDPEIVKIIELRFEQQLTLRRIGERLGVSIGAVDGRLRRALTHLRLAAEDQPVTAAEPHNKLNDEVGTGAAAAIALDAILAERVDVVAPPVAEIGESAVDTAVVTAAVEQAKTLLHGEAEAKPAIDVEATVEEQLGADRERVAPPVAEVADAVPHAEAVADEALRVDSQAHLLPENSVVADPQNEAEPEMGADAMVSETAPGAAINESVAGDLAVASAFEVPPPAESPMGAESHAIEEAAFDAPVAEIGPKPIEPIVAEPPVDVFPAVAAHSATADSDIREYAVGMNPVEATPAAIELMAFPEWVGLEDEAGWYDDWL